MRADELMVGDWVKWKDKYVQIATISGIVYSFGHIDVELAHCGSGLIERHDLKSVSPIPLTKEILEKNGFYFGYTSNEEDLASNTIAQLSEEDKGWVWDEGDGSIKVILPNESDGGMIIIDDQSFDRHLSLVYNNEVYVHELQHLLRLCGVEKSLTI